MDELMALLDPKLQMTQRSLNQPNWKSSSQDGNHPSYSSSKEEAASRFQIESYPVQGGCRHQLLSEICDERGNRGDGDLCHDKGFEGHDSCPKCSENLQNQGEQKMSEQI